jgi:hypothetical protein
VRIFGGRRTFIDRQQQQQNKEQNRRLHCTVVDQQLIAAAKKPIRYGLFPSNSHLHRNPALSEVHLKAIRAIIQ